MNVSEPPKGNYRLITEQEKQVVATLAAIGLPMRRIADYLTNLLGAPTSELRANRIRMAAGIPPPSRAATPTPEAIAAALELLYGDALQVVVARPAGVCCKTKLLKRRNRSGCPTRPVPLPDPPSPPSKRLESPP